MSKETTAELETAIANRQAASNGELRASYPHNDALFANFGDRVLRESHNFVGKPLEVYRQIAAASADDVQKGDTAVNVPMKVVSYYVHEIELTNQSDGEPRMALRTVLYTKEGKRYSFVSDGIVKDLYRMHRLFTPDEWKNGVNLKVVSIPTTPPKRILRLLPV